MKKQEKPSDKAKTYYEGHGKPKAFRDILHLGAQPRKYKKILLFLEWWAATQGFELKGREIADIIGLSKTQRANLPKKNSTAKLTPENEEDIIELLFNGSRETYLFALNGTSALSDTHKVQGLELTKEHVLSALLQEKRKNLIISLEAKLLDIKEKNRRLRRQIDNMKP